jgi:NADPH-dependent curcumin reductase CurA
LNNDQVLVKALYYSNDPAQRGWISPDIPAGRLYVPPVQVGDAMRARGLCEVIDSKSPNLPKGTIVQCSPNWNEYAVLDSHTVTPVQPLPNGLSLTHYLGALGGTGLTAYYGLVVICEAKRGDKVVVSGAAGATGSMVVQIAKHIVGAGNVIGIAGTDDKCRWVESLGADKCECPYYLLRTSYLSWCLHIQHPGERNETTREPGFVCERQRKRWSWLT